MPLDTKVSITIKDLKTKKLTSLKDILNNAIVNKLPVKINTDSKEPLEILRGTYVAITLSKQGYSCNVRIISNMNEIEWICEPSPE